MSVRKAATEDALQIVSLLQEMRSESSYYTPPLSEEKCFRNIEALLAAQAANRALLLICEDDGRVTGSVAAERTEDVWTDSDVVVEHFLYVLPEKRGGFDAGKLALLFKTWAESEPGSIRAQASSGIDDDNAFTMYDKIGWPQRGRVYGMEVF